MQIDLKELRRICEFETKLSKDSNSFRKYINLTNVLASLNNNEAKIELEEDARKVLDKISINPLKTFNPDSEFILLNMNYKVFYYDPDDIGVDTYGLYPYLMNAKSDEDYDLDIDYENEIYNEIVIDDVIDQILFNSIFLSNFDRYDLLYIIDKICEANNLSDDIKNNKLVINISDYDEDSYFYSYDEIRDPNTEIKFIPHSYC